MKGHGKGLRRGRAIGTAPPSTMPRRPMVWLVSTQHPKPVPAKATLYEPPLGTQASFYGFGQVTAEHELVKKDWYKIPPLILHSFLEVITAATASSQAQESQNCSNIERGHQSH